MDPAPLPPKKRSLFTAKAQAKRKKVTEEDALNFSRAKELEAERYAEEERQRQRRIAKSERTAQITERKRSTQSAEDHQSTATPPKKRKVSVKGDEKDGNASDSSAPAEPEEPTWERGESTSSPPESSARNRPPSSRPAARSPSHTLSARYARSLQQDSNAGSRLPRTNYVSLSDSDQPDSIGITESSKSKQQPIQIDSDDEVILMPGSVPVKSVVPDQLFDDEEFPELVQRARERERVRLEQAANAAKSFTEKNHSQDHHNPFDINPPRDVDPTIEILINSEIPNTIPLKVMRKMSQKLREARFVWCDKQKLPGHSSVDLRSVIFLTWKRKKLFDYTTCHALGLKVDEFGNLSNEEGMHEGKVYLEAWTEETFAAAQRDDEVARQREERGEDEEDEAPPANEVIKIKLVLKAKDMEPVKIVVRNTSRVEMLITAFREARQIPEDREVSLFFDGEELDVDSKVEEAELDDLDTLEVHIK